MEIADHLFYNCKFATDLCDWFGRLLNLHLNTSNTSSILKSCDRGWSVQVKDIVLSVITHVVWQIWQARNLARFENCRASFHRAVNLISANITMSGRLSTGKANSSMEDFQILHHFSVLGHFNKAGDIIEVISASLLVDGSRAILMGLQEVTRDWLPLVVFIEIQMVLA